MTKKEHREIHARPATYFAMTQYYFSYQMDLHKFCTLHVADIQQSKQWNNLHLDSPEQWIVNLSFAGRKTFAHKKTWGPPKGFIFTSTACNV